MLSTLQWLAVVGVLAGYLWLVWVVTDEARDRIVAWWTERRLNRRIVNVDQQREERARVLRSINVHKAVSPHVRRIK